MEANHRKILMMQQKKYWFSWDPLDDLGGKFYVERLQCKGRSIFVHLATIGSIEQGLIQVIFVEPIYSFRRIEESACLDVVRGIRGEDEALYQRTFLKCIRAACTKEFEKYVQQQSQPDSLTHFVLLETNSIVDVITSSDPLVTWIKKPLKIGVQKHERSATENNSMGQGLVGMLPDGRITMATAESTDGRPSLIIQEDYDLKGIVYSKIRYTNEDQGE